MPGHIVDSISTVELIPTADPVLEANHRIANNLSIIAGLIRRELLTLTADARPNIEYIDMPESIRDNYQYFTQSETENLRRAGYNADFTPLEEAVRRYVTLYLDRPDRYR